LRELRDPLGRHSIVGFNQNTQKEGNEPCPLHCLPFNVKDTQGSWKVVLPRRAAEGNWAMKLETQKALQLGGYRHKRLEKVKIARRL